MKRHIITVAALLVVIAASATGQTTFSFAVAASGTPQQVQALIDSHADVNAYVGDMTPLIIAASLNKDPEVIALLVKAGANLEAKDLQYGATALMWASYDNSHPEVTAALLKAGADIEAKAVYGRTALMYAAVNNPNPQVIIILLDAGADPKVKDQMGKAALDFARTRTVLNGTDALGRLEKAAK